MIVGRLTEIQSEMIGLLEEAKSLLPNGAAKDRAEAYWIPHITTALVNEHGYMGGDMVTMEDTIYELLEDDDEDEWLDFDEAQDTTANTCKSKNQRRYTF